jgi:hypothetical protein
MAVRREARLLPDCAGRYPGIPSGEWRSAAVLADQVLALWLLRGTSTVLRGRVLPEGDFEFRGGNTRGGEREGLRSLKVVA